MPDFYFTGDDYRYRFEPEAKQRFLDLLRERFNSGVRHNARILKWDMIIESKTNELGRFLTGRTPRLDFSVPAPELERIDDQTLRRKILTVSPREASTHEIHRNTLHYLRRKARSQNSFRVYKKILEKLEEIRQ